MASFRATSCCGMQELAHISYNSKTGKKWDPVKMLSSPFTYSKDIPRCGWIIFTEAGAGCYGQVLADYIKAHDLGEVTKSKDHKNPNHPRRKTGVRVFLWAVDRKKFQAWVNKNVTVRDTPYWNNW